MESTLHLLIVDDDRRMTRTLADIFTLAGHEVVEAWSGQQALEHIQAQHFDCVLSDIRMPGMDGVEMHCQIQQARPGLPVVLMTAFAADELIRQGLEDGVIGALDKPLNIPHLLGFFASLGRQRTIAIIDDDPAFCKTLGDILRQRGFAAIQLTDPHADLETPIAASQVVLLDMKLNSLTGLDVLKTIRAKHPSLPVLLITAYRQEMQAAVQAALEISVSACFYKPLEIPALLEKLAHFQLQRLRSALALSMLP
ncbi:MAG: response regulator [Anaerolineales bacterium]